MGNIKTNHKMSTRISKTDAESIAQAITKPLVKIATEAHDAFKEAVTAAYEATVPDAVIELAKKHKEYVTYASNIRIDGHGFNRQVVSTPRNVISTREDRYSADYTPTVAVAKKLHDAEAVYSKAKAHYEKVYRDTVNALLNLRTYNRIAEQLPEAKPFLPSSVSTAIVLNLSGLRRDLQQIAKTA